MSQFVKDFDGTGPIIGFINQGMGEVVSMGNSVTFKLESGIFNVVFEYCFDGGSQTCGGRKSEFFRTGGGG
ncbi:MAG: hypothetical protein UX78_C0008G0028 [Candidatus Amesbacteria bacterium GW2011_GWA2_47_11]|uniref:Uncharacterized protein n=1 Tax=Candidatus Amesbacteria bacterium GW2011_GWA2_47_11 TaxID=1618357 RepID=A0A0G1RGL5_9BACT|nr:MAG: hypothetical protein UX78_C0008G0028 [Candidatus Amesbacteria bacterium GW2011_GWA2_47_11]